MILKVRNGQTIQQAVEEIITRAIGELRKNAFGDDTDGYQRARHGHANKHGK